MFVGEISAFLPSGHIARLEEKKKVFHFHCFGKFIGVFRSCSPTHLLLEVGSGNEPLKSGITLRVSHFCLELFMP